MALALPAAMLPAEPEALPDEEELRGLFGAGENALLPDPAQLEDVIKELRTAQVELREIFLSYAIERATAGEAQAEGAAVSKVLPLAA